MFRTFLVVFLSISTRLALTSPAAQPQIVPVSTAWNGREKDLIGFPSDAVRESPTESQ